MGKKYEKQKENRKRSELIKARKKRKKKFNKVGIEIMSDRPPRQRFIYGEMV